MLVEHARAARRSCFAPELFYNTALAGVPEKLSASRAARFRATRLRPAPEPAAAWMVELAHAIGQAALRRRPGGAAHGSLRGLGPPLDGFGEELAEAAV